MRAIVSSSAQDAYNVQVADIATPEPGPGQVQIAVAAAVVNPVDELVADPGLLRSFGMTDLPAYLGLGWDLAGTISAVGPEANGYRLGQKVIGLVDKFVTPIGAQSEFVVLDVAAVAALPDDADLIEAATLPLNATTALQALHLAKVTDGTTLLVTGAAGAVGGYAVELAADLGARVIGVGRTGDEDQVRRFGAQEFLVGGDDLVQRVRILVPDGVDAVIDGASLVDQVSGVLAGGGHFVAVTDATVPDIDGATAEKVSVHADPDDLAAVVDAWRAGRISTRVADRYAFEQVADAQQRLAAGGVRGRLVLLP
jgi:NADPH2:quinone reductase